MRGKAGSLFKDFEVFVRTSDGQVLNEHTTVDLSNDKKDTSIAYLECPGNTKATFGIVFTQKTVIQHDVRIKAEIDGRLIYDVVLRQFQMLQERPIDRLLDRKDEQLYEYTLSFFNLLTEYDTERLDQKKLAALGEIAVTFIPGKIMDPSIYCGPVTANSKIGAISEKSKKATLEKTIVGVHVVPFVDRGQHSLIFNSMPGDTWHTFVFKYMSRQMLMARRIIEPPTPPPESDDGEIEEGDTAAARSAVAPRLRPRAKLVQAGNDVDVKPRFKRTLNQGSSARTARKRRRQSGKSIADSIDLTEE